MGSDLHDRAEAADRKLHAYPQLYRVKHVLDLLLPAALLVIPVILYLEFVAASTHALYPYKQPMQILILAYFLAELSVDFLIYEQARDFFRDRWLDILLTLPFFTAFKAVTGALRGLTGLKLLKGSKTAKAAKAGKGAKVGKAGKLGKAGKGFKTGQKLGKLVTKGKKLVRKWLKNRRK